MKRLLPFLLSLLFSVSLLAQFSISTSHRFLLKDGKPFFWLGDTGWELFHRLTREEADQYLRRRSEQGFTVIQAVALAEFDGLHTPNANGDLPFINDDPEKPNEKYFQHVDYIIDKAASYNINIALLPTWGDKVYKDKWGTGPEIFNEQNAAIYAAWLATRYKDKKNIIWILGGDRIPRGEKDIAVWNAMGNAIMKATNNKAIISFHPQPNELGSAQWFHKENWLAFNMFQTGHCRDAAVYDRMQADYNLQPTKPVLDAEPIYEDHPVCFNVKDLGTSNAYDVRRSAYLDLFAGAFGHTYGCHDIWQFYSTKREAVNGPHVYWEQALELPGANQMIFVKKLIESHSYLDRRPDQSLIQENNNAPSERIQSTRGDDYLFVYSTTGKSFHVVLGKINGNELQAYWYNPRNGQASDLPVVENKGIKEFKPPTSGYGQDWVLVLDDAAKKYPKP
ncbi:MAG: glycoside hydrolase family 140 protein [Chitinophagaceae bacterium]